MYNYDSFERLEYVDNQNNFIFIKENQEENEDQYFKCNFLEPISPNLNINEDSTKITNSERIIDENIKNKSIYFMKSDKNNEENKDKNKDIFKNETNSNSQTFINKKRGRAKIKGDYEHNKFSNDNMIRKCKHLVLDSLLYFINYMIEIIYEDSIGKGIFKKVLLKINQKQKTNASVQYNKEFLNKSIGDIFSDDISGRITYFPNNHNKILINSLKNSPEAKKPEYFTKLFNLSFLECLQHFRGSIEIEELKGMKGIEIIKEKYKGEDEYTNALNYYLMNYETIINSKRPRFRKSKTN